MEDEYFNEKIILNMKPGGFTSSEIWIDLHRSDFYTHFCRNTMYKQTRVS